MKKNKNIFLFSVKKDWEKLYQEKGKRHKNKYPNTEIVSFIFKNYGSYSHSQRKKIKILDLGCGWGNNLKFLKNENFNVYGIDGSPTAIEHCKSITKHVEVGELEKLPYKSNYFDMVIDRNSIQCNNIGKIRKIIKEIYRVLKKDGLFYSIILRKTNHPEKFHAEYLKEKQDNFEKIDIYQLFKNFRKIKLDYINESFNDGALKIYNYKIIAEK